jgi:Stage II sporulation protein E (SpoIIE)
MRTHLSGATAAARAVSRRAPWQSLWLELSSLVIIAFVLISCFRHTWDVPMLVPLLAVPPALAGIGAASVRRPLGYGAVSLLAVVLVEFDVAADVRWLPVATMITVVVITAVAATGTEISVRQERLIAEVSSVAEAAQRALLRPLPARLGPLSFGVVYLAAAAEAKVGGDLYEVVQTAGHGIRLIIGDVRGKGLGAIELASDVLGMFRELAHDAGSLAELAARLDAGVARGAGGREEFVTALLVEIDPEAGRTSVFSCGHPTPLLISAAAEEDRSCHVSLIDVPLPAPPLGLLILGRPADPQRSFEFGPNEQLLLYTDGVTEARDAKGTFYPLPERIGVLAAKTAGKGALWSPAGGGVLPPCQDMLDLIRADLLRHTGAPLGDDAALLLVRAPAGWPGGPGGPGRPDRSRRLEGLPPAEAIAG